MDKICKAGTAGILLCALTLFAGCWYYSFSGSTLPPHINTVAVPLFQNRTSEYGVDQQLTDAVISAVTRDNSLKIADRDNADSVIDGTIVRIVDRAGQYNADETASDYRVTIELTVTFRDVEKREVIWEKTWSQWGSYETDRNSGIEAAVEKLAADIVNQTVSEW